MGVVGSVGRSHEQQVLPNILQRFHKVRMFSTVVTLWIFIGVGFFKAESLFEIVDTNLAKFFEDIEVLGMKAYYLLIMLFIAHHLRLFFGWQFMDSDMSFLAARLEASPRKRKKKDLGEVILRVLLVTLMGLFFFFLPSGDLRLVAGLLSFQVLIVGLYDVIFWKELYRWDRQRAANRFILVGDLSLLAAVLLVWMMAWGWIASDNAAFVVGILLGTIGAIFFGELFSQYFAAFVWAHRELLFSFRHWLTSAESVSADDVVEGADHSWRFGSVEVRKGALEVGGKTSVGDWEKPLQERMAELAVADREKPVVLEIGYGLGLATSKLHSYPIGYHLLVEGHPSIAARAISEYYRRNVRIVCGIWQDVLPALRSQTFDAVLFDPDAFNDPSFDNSVGAMLRLVGNGLVDSAYLLRAKGSFIFWDASGQLKSNLLFQFLVSTYYGEVREHFVSAVPPAGHPYAEGANFVILEVVKDSRRGRLRGFCRRLRQLVRRDAAS